MSAHNLIKAIEFGHIPSPLHENFKCRPCQYKKNKHLETTVLHNLSYQYDESAVNFNIPNEASHVKYASLRMMPSNLCVTTLQQILFYFILFAKVTLKALLGLSQCIPQTTGFMW